jgi:hypothetical protein
MHVMRHSLLSEQQQVRGTLVLMRHSLLSEQQQVRGTLVPRMVKTAIRMRGISSGLLGGDPSLGSLPSRLVLAVGRTFRSPTARDGRLKMLGGAFAECRTCLLLGWVVAVGQHTLVSVRLVELKCRLGEIHGKDAAGTTLGNWRLIC